jgi:hypothetical protein
MRSVRGRRSVRSMRGLPVMHADPRGASKACAKVFTNKQTNKPRLRHPSVNRLTIPSLETGGLTKCSGLPPSAHRPVSCSTSIRTPLLNPTALSRTACPKQHKPHIRVLPRVPHESLTSTLSPRPPLTSRRRCFCLSICGT